MGYEHLAAAIVKQAYEDYMDYTYKARIYSRQLREMEEEFATLTKDEEIKEMLKTLTRLDREVSKAQQVVGTCKAFFKTPEYRLYTTLDPEKLLPECDKLIIKAILLYPKVQILPSNLNSYLEKQKGNDA